MTSDWESSVLPSNSGRNTSGPSAAPNSEPNSTSEMPRPRLRGRIQVGRRDARQQHRAAGDADQHEPGDHQQPCVGGRAGRRQHAAGNAAQAAGGQHRHPSATVHRPAGGQRGQRCRRQEHRRAQSEDRLDAGDQDERDRRHRDDQLQHPGEARQGRRQEHGRAADDVRLDHRAIMPDGLGRPAGRRRRASTAMNTAKNTAVDVSTMAPPEATAHQNEMYSPTTPSIAPSAAASHLHHHQPVGQQPRGRRGRDQHRQHQDVADGAQRDDDRQRDQRQQDEVEHEHRVAHRLRHLAVERDQRELLVEQEDSADHHQRRRTAPSPGRTR